MWAMSLGVPLLAYVKPLTSRIPYVVSAVLAIPLAWSPDPVGGVLLWWALVMLVFLVAVAPLDLTKAYWGIGLGLSINSVFAALQWYGYEPIQHVGAGWAVSGLFFNKSPQNNFIALAVIGLLSIKDWRAWCIAAWAALPLFAPAISRGPLMALAAAGLVLLWRYSRWMAVVAAVIAVLALLAAIGQPGRLGSNVDRLTTWFDAVHHMNIIGNGLGSFRWHYPEMEYAHNDLIQLAYEFGPVGVIAYAMLALTVLWWAGLTERLILVAFLTEGLFAFPLYWPATSFLAALCAGSALRRRALYRPVVRVERVNHAGQVVERYAV